jgi:hypothetical protein
MVISELRSTWLISTRRSPAPFDRAVRTYSSVRLSSTDERSKPAAEETAA